MRSSQASWRRSARRSNEDHRRRVAGAGDRSAAGIGHASDRRSRARDACFRCSQAGSEASRICEWPIFSRAAARLGSKRCRAGRPTRRSWRAMRKPRRRSCATRRSSERAARVRVIAGSALALPRSEPFDLIFADPPYARVRAMPWWRRSREADWLAPGRLAERRDAAAATRSRRADSSSIRRARSWDGRGLRFCAAR